MKMSAHAVCISLICNPRHKPMGRAFVLRSNQYGRVLKELYILYVLQNFAKYINLRFAWNPKMKVFCWKKISSKRWACDHSDLPWKDNVIPSQCLQLFWLSVFELNPLFQPDQIIFLRHCDELDTIFQSWYLLLSEHYFKPYESRRHIKKYLHLC